MSDNRITVRLTPEQQEQVRKLADLDKSSQSAVIVGALTDRWARDGKRAEAFAKLREEHDR